MTQSKNFKLAIQKLNSIFAEAIRQQDFTKNHVQGLYATFNQMLKHDSAVNLIEQVTAYQFFYSKLEAMESEIGSSHKDEYMDLKYINRIGIESEATIKIGMQLLKKIKNHYLTESQNQEENALHFKSVAEIVSSVCDSDALKHLVLVQQIIDNSYDYANMFYNIARARQIVLEEISEIYAEVIKRSGGGKSQLSYIKSRCGVLAIFAKLMLVELKLKADIYSVGVELQAIKIPDKLGKDSKILTEGYNNLKRKTFTNQLAYIEKHETKILQKITAAEKSDSLEEVNPYLLQIKTCLNELKDLVFVNKRKHAIIEQKINDYSKALILTTQLVRLILQTQIQTREEKEKTVACFKIAAKNFPLIKDLVQVLHLLSMRHWNTYIIAPIMAARPNSLKINLPEPISIILNLFIQNGFHAMLVGGVVRDLLLGKTFADVDIITDMPSNLVLSLFDGHSILKNKYLSGVCQTVISGLKIDISYCINDIFVSWKALVNNAINRIFTINSLYCDIEGNIYDPLHVGLHDLVRMPTLRLIINDICCYQREPGLIFRAVRLMSKYNLYVDEEMLAYLKMFSPYIKGLPPSLLAIEHKRLFLRGLAVSSLYHLLRIGIFEMLYPQIYAFMESHIGNDYKIWLFNNLAIADKLVNEQKVASLAYVEALFLTGAVLAELSGFRDTITYTSNEMLEDTVDRYLYYYSNKDLAAKVRHLALRFIHQYLASEEINNYLVETGVPLFFSQKFISAESFCAPAIISHRHSLYM